MNSKEETVLSQELLYAVEKNDAPASLKLIESGCDVNTRDKGQSTPLMRGSFHGYFELVAMLLRLRADVNLHDKIGKTALHYATQANREDIVRMLLQSGADVNSQDLYGNSPLSDAVFYSEGKGALIGLLRKSGADDNLPNKHGVTPLGLAKSIANYNLLQFFEQ